MSETSHNNLQKVFILSTGQILEKSIILFFKPYLSRILDLQEYGTYSQIIFIGEFLFILFSLGISQTFYVFLAKNDNSKKDVIHAFLVLGLITGLISLVSNLALTFVLADEFNNPELKNTLWLYSFYPLFTILNSILQLILLYENKSKQLVFINISVNILKVATIVILTRQFSNTLPQIIFILGLAAPLLTLILYYHNSSLELLKVRSSYNNVIAVLKFTWPVGLTLIMGGAYFYANGFTVNTILGSQKYAIFVNGIIDIPFISTLFTTIATITLTNYATLINENNLSEVVKLKRHTILQTACLVYPIAIVLLFFSKELITTYFSMKYIGSVPIFIIYTFILFLKVTDYHDILISLGKQSLLVKYYVIFFIFLFTSSWYLTKNYGIIGSAFAVTGSTYCVFFFLLKKTAFFLNSSLNEIVDWKSISKIIIISTLITFPFFILNSAIEIASILKLLVTPFILLIIYLSLVKTKLINIEMYQPLLNKIPFGKLVHKFLS